MFFIPLFFHFTLFKNHPKSLIQHCERSELRLHFVWPQPLGFQKLAKWDQIWHFQWTFVHSKCKRSSLRSQCWMRLFLRFSNTIRHFFHISGQNVYDSLHIIFAILDTIRTSFFEGFYPKFMLPSFPWFHYPLYRISLAGSIYMTVATAIERYLAVCSPHNYHQMNMASQMRYIYYVVPVTVAATVVNVPRFFESEYAWR